MKRRDDAVDLGVGEGGVERGRELLGGRLRRQRHRPVRDLQAPADAGARAERPEGVGVADDGDAVTLGQRLVEGQLRDVEELVDVLDADDAGLAQQGVERLRAARW